MFVYLILLFLHLHVLSHSDLGAMLLLGPVSSETKTKSKINQIELGNNEQIIVFY